MGPRFKTNLLEHTKAVGAWARERAAHAVVDAVDFSLALRYEQRSLKLHAQFVGRREGRQLAYFDVADHFAVGFVGWLPYKPQAWPLSLSKLVFKSAARELGLRTPALWTDPATIDAPFLVKRSRGAFGDGMRGPFAPAEAAALSLAEGEYAEAFTWGRIARAWYWCGRLAVLEAFEMPSVEGDGRSDYQALLQRAGAEVPADFAVLARLQGVQPDDVLPAGQRVVCDYRYVSPYNPTLYANHNLLPRAAGSPLAERFAAAGGAIWPLIPGAPAQQAGFVLDAIVDAQGEPWFLELNSNAQGHPDFYAPMFDTLFGLAPREG